MCPSEAPLGVIRVATGVTMGKIGHELKYLMRYFNSACRNCRNCSFSCKRVEIPHEVFQLVTYFAYYNPRSPQKRPIGPCVDLWVCFWWVFISHNLMLSHQISSNLTKSRLLGLGAQAPKVSLESHIALKWKVRWLLLVIVLVYSPKSRYILLYLAISRFHGNLIPGVCWV